MFWTSGTCLWDAETLFGTPDTALGMFSVEEPMNLLSEFEGNRMSDCDKKLLKQIRKQDPVGTKMRPSEVFLRERTDDCRDGKNLISPDPRRTSCRFFTLSLIVPYHLKHISDFQKQCIKASNRNARMYLEIKKVHRNGLYWLNS